MSKERPLAWVVDNRGCWIVTSHVPGSDKYIHMMVDGKTTKAHRLAYERANGPIPKGMCVCHSCDNPICINPAHLWLGTSAENVRDMVKKGRVAKGEEVGTAKLTAAQVLYIREHTEINGVEMARLLGIDKCSITRIRLRKGWKHLP